MPSEKTTDVIGQLTLSDAMLGELITDVLRLLANANYPAESAPVREGRTTSKVAEVLENYLKDERALFGDDVAGWLDRVRAAVNDRDKIVHAIAQDQCISCGSATSFTHPRTSTPVDRSHAAVLSLTARYETLRREGLTIARDVASRLNDRILRIAEEEANATGEIQTPPQYGPQQVTHICAECSGDGQGGMFVGVPTAVAVVPKKDMQKLQERVRCDRKL